MNYYLMIHNHPPLIIYDEDKQLYYEHLQKYGETEDLLSIYEFLKFETGKTWEKTLAKFLGIKQECKGLPDFITPQKPEHRI